MVLEGVSFQSRRNGVRLSIDPNSDLRPELTELASSATVYLMGALPKLPQTYQLLLMMWTPIPVPWKLRQCIQTHFCCDSEKAVGNAYPHPKFLLSHIYLSICYCSVWFCWNCLWWSPLNHFKILQSDICGL